MNIKVEKAVVQLTETTLRELLKAAEQAKSNATFEDTPMPVPVGDMSVKGYLKERHKRGIIRVNSPFADIDFDIDLEVTPNTQESLGYELSSSL